MTLVRTLLMSTVIGLVGCGGSGVTIPEMGANDDLAGVALGCAGLSKCVTACGASTSPSFNACLSACTAAATPQAYNLLAAAVFYCPAEEFCRSAPDGGTPPCSADDVDPTKMASASCTKCVDAVTAVQLQDECANAIHDCDVNGP